MLDSTQVISGLGILLSFFVGYKYALKIHCNKSDTKNSSSSSEGQLFSMTGNYKMILVVRNDLKMGKGKVAAQCAHAAVGAYQSGMKKYPQLIRQWDSFGSAKIAVKVDSEAELMTIRKLAILNDLNVCLIRDAGRTQIEPNTKTVLAVGPALDKDVDKITGHLKLL